MTLPDEASLAAALQADLARHAGFGIKVSGSAGDAATAAWIGARLAALGFELRRAAVEVPYFEAGTCRLRLGAAQGGGRDAHAAPVLAQAPYRPTPPGGLTAVPAVVRESDEAADARGRIALVVLPHARHASLTSPLVAPLVAAAEAAGALAIVIVPTGPTGDLVALNAPIDAPGPCVPLAVLAPRDAAPFLRAARRAEPVTLELDGEVQRRRTDNLLAWRRRGPRWLCLSTPRTGWFTCAAERGTGTAALLAMADWAAQRFPELSLFVLNTGAHEYHFAGAAQALGSAPAPADTVVWVHLGAALAARDRLEMRGHTPHLPSADPNRFTMATEALQAAAREAFRGLPGLEAVRAPMEGVSELATVLRHGHTRALAALGMPRSFHTPQDDLEGVDGALLAPVVRAHMQVVEAAVREASAASAAGAPA